MDEKLNTGVNMRLSEDLAHRLDKMDAVVGIGRAAVLRACLEAASLISLISFPA